MQSDTATAAPTDSSAGSEGAFDIVLTHAGAQPDAIAAKLLEPTDESCGPLACADLIVAIREVLTPGLKGGLPLPEAARQHREPLGALFHNQLPRAIFFAAAARDAVNVRSALLGLGASVQLSSSDPARATPWQTGSDAFDLILTREGNSLESLKEVRRLTGLGYARAKELLASLPQVIKVGLSESEAENLGRIFDRLGAEVELRRRHAASTSPAAPVSSLTTSQFGLATIEESLQRASAGVDPYPRIQQLRTSYTGILRPAWRAYVDKVELFVQNAKLAQESEESAIRSETAQATAEVERRFAASIADENVRLEKVQSELSASVNESTSVAKRVWDARGQGLDQPDAEYELPRKRAAITILAGAPVSAESVNAAQQEYEFAKSQAEAHPQMRSPGSDPTVQKFLKFGGWIAGILFVILWSTQGFALGLLLGSLLLTGVMLIPFLDRSVAAQAYEKLLEKTARLQCLKQAAADAKCAEIRTRIASEQKNLETEKGGIQKLASARLRIIAEKYDQTARETGKAFTESTAKCRDVIERFAKRIERAIQERPATYATLDTRAVSAVLEEIVFADRTRFRFARDLAIPLVKPNAPTATYLNLTGSVVEPLALKVTPPIFWDFNAKRSLLISDDRPASTGAEAAVSGVITRVLHQIPPGKVNFTFFDPIGLGRNFSKFLKLADFSDQLINGRVWSDKEHIRRKLKDLIEHIETVTQKYLRNDFPDIETYNVNAGEIAEPYRIMVALDFPESFDEETTRDLVRIVQNGPRCGVFAIIHTNTALKLPHGVDLEPLRPFCAELKRQDGLYWFGAGGGAQTEQASEPIAVDLDESCSEAVVNDVVAKFGGGAQKAMRVEVPYQRLLNMAGFSGDAWWQNNSAHGIEVPLGPTGAKKVQTLRLGHDMAIHALIVGRPGSGKSNLVHVFITTIAQLYAPDEVQLYLIDFKKGVEFKCYAESRLPHARVIAIESEREFGLSVLEGLDAELKSRGELFRASGSANIAEYRSKTKAKLPRIVLVVDEFQEFFTRDDRIKNEATMLFDRLVKQGRAFGIHLVLGTQSLANAGLGQATRDQMAVRIALQCSEADSRLILGEDNTAARLLNRPGEAIYNDAAGRIEGNNLFQVALFSDEDRTRELAAISETSKAKGWRGDDPIIFEGHEPAHIADCRPITAALAAAPVTEARPVTLWLGEPTSLRPTTAVLLKRQSGRNLMVLTRDEEQGVGVVLAGMLSIAAQTRPERGRFSIVDLTSADACWADHPEEFAAAVPHRVEVLGRRDIKAVVPELDAEVLRRTEAGLMKEPAIFLVLLGLQRARDLRQSDGMGSSSLSIDLNTDDTVNLPQCLARILREGPEVGVHTLIWCDTYANLDRALDRSSINEIGLRISGPLAAAESHRLFDDEIASAIDKPHRMLKYDDDQVGAFELFRPYAIAPVEYIAAIGKALKARKQ